MNGKLCSVARVRLHDDWKAKCENILQRWYKKLLNIFTALLRITWIIHKILFASQRFRNLVWTKMVICHVNVFT